MVTIKVLEPGVINSTRIYCSDRDRGGGGAGRAIALHKSLFPAIRIAKEASALRATSKSSNLRRFI